MPYVLCQFNQSSLIELICTITAQNLVLSKIGNMIRDIFCKYEVIYSFTYVGCKHTSKHCMASGNCIFTVMYNPHAALAPTVCFGVTCFPWKRLFHFNIGYIPSTWEFIWLYYTYCKYRSISLHLQLLISRQSLQYILIYAGIYQRSNLVFDVKILDITVIILVNICMGTAPIYYLI